MNKIYLGVIVVGVLILLLAAAFITPAATPEPITPSPTTNVPVRVTKQGTWVCLPHTDITGPQTMECAFGLKVDSENTYYGLDTQLLSSGPINFPTETMIEVEGLLVPVEQLSSNWWQRYPITGIISVTSVREISSLKF